MHVIHDANVSASLADAASRLTDLADLISMLANFVVVFAALIGFLLSLVLYLIITEKCVRRRKPDARPPPTVIRIAKSSHGSNSRASTSRSKKAKKKGKKKERKSSKSVSTTKKHKKAVKTLNSASRSEQPSSTTTKSSSKHFEPVSGKRLDMSASTVKSDKSWGISTLSVTDKAPSLSISKNSSVGARTPQSDVSARSKQHHSSQCPGTDSFGTSASSFSVPLMSPKCERGPPSHENLRTGDFMRNTQSGASSTSTVSLSSITTKSTTQPSTSTIHPPPHVYNPHNVPRLFATAGVVTAKETTNTISYTHTALSPPLSRLTPKSDLTQSDSLRSPKPPKL